MRTSRLKRSLQAFGLAACLWPAILTGQTRSIDTGHSVLITHVFKGGLFAEFAHNHEIAAPIADGAVEVSPRPRVSLRVDARRMRVLDPEILYNDSWYGDLTLHGQTKPVAVDHLRYLRHRCVRVSVREIVESEAAI